MRGGGKGEGWDFLSFLSLTQFGYLSFVFETILTMTWVLGNTPASILLDRRQGYSLKGLNSRGKRPNPIDLVKSKLAMAGSGVIRYATQ